MANSMSRGRKRIIIAIAAVVTLVGGGVAFAYWTSGGTGAGTATSGASVEFTIAADPAVGTIVPGNEGQTVDFTVTNPGDGPQYLTSVVASLAGPTGTAWVPPAGCLIGDYTVTMTTAPAAGVIASLGTVDGMVTVTLANTGLNQDACQGEEVPLYFVAS